jgi:hypothetical protein
MHQRSSLFKISLSCGLAGLSVLTAFVAGEFSVRLAEPELDPTRHLRFIMGEGNQPTLGYRNTEKRQIKNTGDFNVKIRINEFGLRDSKSLSQGTAEDYYLVGDSFTFGWGVEEHQRISERLEALTGKPVFNLSMPTGIDGYEKLLDYAISNGAPIRNVIIAVSMETNIIDYDQEKKLKPPPAQLSGKSVIRKLKNFLTGNSALYIMATTLIHRSPILKDVAARWGVLIPNLQGVRRFEFSEKIILSSARRLAAIARRFKTTVAILPSRALWVGRNKTVEEKRHRAFVTHLNAMGLSVVDLKPAFEKDGNPLAYHFANDPHWKPTGHALAAKALANFMASRQ